MAERNVDRGAWATVVAELMDAETKGNRTRFAALVGVTYKTVNRWLNQETGVSEESVRQVARALRIPPANLLVRVGYYAADELATAEPVDRDDPAIQLILTSDVPPRVKQRMIERLYEMRARQVDDVQWWIDQAKGDG